MKTNTKFRYEVRNEYFDGGKTNHRKIECAYKAASKREGDGWIVVAINRKTGVEYRTSNNGYDYYIESKNGDWKQVA